MHLALTTKEGEGGVVVEAAARQREGESERFSEGERRKGERAREERG